MAMAVQPQLDIGTATFALTEKSLGLVRAATVDDVQPTAILAAVALGSQMIVDRRLIGKAIDALGGEQSFRMESIKLYLGLSSGGVSSQIRQSTPAIKTFLLISALKLHMLPEEIGDVLYDLLVRSKAIDDVPASPKQLAKLVRAVEGHAMLLEKTETVASNFLIPMLEKIVTSEGCLEPAYMSQIAANQASQTLLTCFDALRDDEVHHIEISGAAGLTYLICLLSWLCPDSIHATTRRGLVLTECTSEAAKIHICLDATQQDWRIQHFYKIGGLATLVDNIEKDPTYRWDACPSHIPMRMTYLALCAHGPEWFSSVERAVRILSHGIIQAALDHGRVRRKGQLRNPQQSVAFHEICSEEQIAALRQGLRILGFPLDVDDLAYGPVISAFFPRHSDELLPPERHTLMLQLDITCLDGLADAENMEDFRKVQIIELVMTIAETVLVRATQTQPADVPFRAAFLDTLSLGGQHTLLCSLVSSEEAAWATDFMYAALQSLKLQSEKPAGDISSYLACSYAGQVAYLAGVVHYPKTTAEAFKIVVQPGRIKWKDDFEGALLDCQIASWSNSSALHTTYRLLDEQGSNTLLPTLRNTSHRKDGFTVSNHPLGPSLQYVEAATGDRSAMFTQALANWALAERVERSQRTHEDQIRECVKQGVAALRLKHPGDGQVGLDADFETRMSVATFGDDPWANLLRFGSGDAVNAYHLIQGCASIPDCVIEARRLYGSNFIIMANA